jgi:PAS domain S-box-containing protein
MSAIETYFDSILDVLTDGIYLSDRDGNTLKVNTMYEKLIGLKREDLVGRKVQDSTPRSSRRDSRPPPFRPPRRARS